jgi:hypothetical protein
MEKEVFGENLATATWMGKTVPGSLLRISFYDAPFERNSAVCV